MTAFVQPGFLPGKQRPTTASSGGSLKIDKAAIAARVAAAPGIAADQESMLAQILEAIRRFIAGILRALGLRRNPPAPPKETAEQAVARAKASQPAPAVVETPEEIRVDGLPESTLDRLRITVDEIVNAADGSSLSDSLRETLTSMPDIQQRQVLRVLINQNAMDTKQARELSASTMQETHAMLAPFCEKHAIKPDAALALLRADLSSISGVLAAKIDPDCTIRQHVGELQKLDSALAGLACHRGVLCTLAMDSGAYSRDEVSRMVHAAGIDPAFLSPAASEVLGVPSAEPQPAAGHLVERGMMDVGQANELLQGATVDAALSTQRELKADGQDDDVSEFLSQPSIGPRQVM